MNTKAIYTVHENGKEHYFFSEHAGGFSYPFAVADFLHSLKGVLNDPMSPQKGLCAAPMLELKSFAAAGWVIYHDSIHL